MSIQARYFDGVRPIPLDAVVSRRASHLVITLQESGAEIVWPVHDTLREQEGETLRLMHVVREIDTGERITLNGAAFAAHFGPVLSEFRALRAGDASMRKIAFWVGAAMASMAFLVLVGIPFLARHAAPLVPFSVEQRLGALIEPQVLEMFGRGKTLPTCGAPGGPGARALARMVERLTQDVALPGPLKVDVLDTPMTNAFALPGGRIFLFRPVLEKAANANEVAGVLAHEIGHVIHRDAMRALLHDGAISLLIGLALGDVTGGSTVASLGQMLLGNAYSRENEREADEVSVTLMRKAGADPRAINSFFRRLMEKEPKGDAGGLLSVFLTHPVTKERVETVDKLAKEGGEIDGSIMSAVDWKALQSICQEKPAEKI